MKGKSLLLLLSLLSAIIVNAKGYYFKHLGVADGLSQVCIPSIYQDELGMIWLGTTEGLNRYNGKDVKVFRPSPGNGGLTNNEIDELCGDKKGKIYIRSEGNLIQLDIYKEKFTCLRQNDVKGLFCKEDTLWVSCSDGIYYYSGENSDFTLMTRLQNKMGMGRALYVNEDMIWTITDSHLVAISRKNPDRQKILASFRGSKCISRDSAGNLWAGTWEGVYRISVDGEVTRYTSAPGMGELTDNQVRCVLEDDFKRIWIGTFRGLDCYDPATDKWSHYARYGNSSNTLSHHSVLSLHKDIQGNIWVGTFYGGVNVFNANEVNNHFYSAEPLQEDCLSFPVVGKMTEDSRENLWICTEGGLNCYDSETGTFTRYQHRKGDANSIGSDNLKSIFYRKENDRLYVGTHLGGMFVLDLKSNKGHTLHPVKNDPTSLPHEIVNDIQEYKDGFAVLTQGGLVFMNPETEKFSPLSNDTLVRKLLSREYAYETFMIDSRQRIWLATGSGKVVCIHLLSSKVAYYRMNADNPAAMGRIRVSHIFEDSSGDVYFSTIGSGVFKYQEKEDSFKSYGAFNQCLPSDYCYYICESVKDHHLFILHEKGFSVFNKEREEVENTYHLFNQTYTRGSALYAARDGSLYISGTNGLALFRNRFLHTSPSKDLLNFDRLFIFNEEIRPDDKTGILTNILAKTSDVYLSYKQNNVTVELATFNYNNDRNRLFEYRLDGFDKAWTQTSGMTITYTNLPSGDYTLRARPAGNKENPSEEIRLNIHVSTPFYATIWAYLFYLLCLTGLLIAFVRFKTRQAALKSSLEFERKEKERIEELNQIKLRFFTNISHEFRTPLTLILAQIEVLMNMDKLGTGVYNRILRIYKNAWHMRSLISELLDFRKQEQGYLKLKVKEQNLVTFTRQIYMCFYEFAQKKEITYQFDSAEEKIPVWFDSIQLQKVIFNLLSNAFKYTPDNGNITVAISKTDSQAVISVSDSGVGIPEAQITKIFQRFYQTDNASSSFTLGTGIGLALAKGIVNMHHGEIDVQSTVGEGTRFTLSLPLGNLHFSEEEMAATESGETAILPEAVPVHSFEQNEMEENDSSWDDHMQEKDKPVILLVEDNEELLSMLADVFLPMYEVHIAHNGREGWDMARQIQPDLIVSDVMMPEMSGKELCYKIKTSVELSHISVVLLTAQASVEYVMEGLMFGADDYVTKPFNVKMLVARCNNLIKNKKRLIEHYAGKTVTESPVADAVNEREKELLAKSVKIVRENFTNPDFDVTALASELCMGRSKLYTQFKQMTGLTPNEFILKVKLDEAMSLLENRPELNISEISMCLGFSSPRYFSRSFKAFFGIAPQGVRNKKEE